MNIRQMKKQFILKTSCFGLAVFFIITANMAYARENLTLSIETATDIIAITHSKAVPLGLFPEGIQALKPETEHGSLALLSYVRDAAGKRIGFASELEDFPPAPENVLEKPEEKNWATVWTITLPGRGSIIAFHYEHLTDQVAEAFAYPKLHNKSWEGELFSKNTTGPLEGGFGRIIGGSEEFEGVTGHFIEEGILTSVTTSGELHATIILKFIFDKK